MGKLIIEGNSVYEVDEECIKRRAVPESCEVLEAIKRMEQREKERGSAGGQGQHESRW
ncbi:MAG: hypothetical protein J1D89_02580 [Agathobacter sp.]|nr:hypothetical protein [Agathobacter sp.]